MIKRSGIRNVGSDVSKSMTISARMLTVDKDETVLEYCTGSDPEREYA